MWTVIVLLLAIGFIIYMTGWVRLHAFVVLLLAAYGVGLLAGVGPVPTLEAIRAGFGGTVGYIGIVITLGAVIGTLLEKSGAALTMANTMLKLVGKTRSALAMGLTGYVTSIPVFCDSGFVILSPLNRALAARTGASLATLKATPIAGYIGQTLSTLNLGIFLPFIIAAGLKTAQGSSTVAIITTSSLLAPLLPGLGMDSEMARALVVLAVGAGAMTVSHANDSYFWVVSQFSDMDDVTVAYRTQSLGTLVVGVTTALTVWVMSLILM